MLLLDAGNSRCKWALVQDGKWIRQGSAGYAADELEQGLRSLPTPARILFSNVAGEPVAQRLRAACAEWGMPVEQLYATLACCGVRNGYHRPEQLGSDRWAALIAAWHRVRGACLVVSCGTATTVDALSSRGEFLGGLILPGIELMRRSLATGTANLAEASGDNRDFPCYTADAIQSGAVRATVGAVEHQYRLLRAREEQVLCLLGGGAAGTIATYLQLPLERAENLVLEGLQVIGETEA